MQQSIKLFETFEAFLGKSLADENVFSFNQILKNDESENYPDLQIAALNDFNLYEYFIPVSESGKLRDIKDLAFLMRLVARRDLTTSIAYGGSFLGAITIWISGSEELKKRVASDLSDKKKIAFSITESGNGSDLMLTSLEASPDNESGKFLLRGQKWLYNHTTKSHHTTIFAKTSSQADARSFTLFYTSTDLAENSNSIVFNERIRTLGLKGLDLGSINFNNHPVCTQSIIGTQGSGIELALKGLQVTKALCASLSLGSLDTLFRTTLKFTLNRKLYNGIIFNIPILKNTLAEIYIENCILESLCLVSNRMLNNQPQQYGIISAIVKAYVPSSAEKLTRQLSSILGARSYIRNNDDFGIFQKQARDNSIISIFEGNVYVNLQYLLQEMKIIFSIRKNRKIPSSDFFRNLFSFDTTPYDLEFSKLSISSKGKDDLLFGLNYITKVFEKECIPDDTLEDIQTLLRELTEYISVLEEMMNHADAIVSNTYTIDPKLYEIAHHYCLLHAANAISNILYHNKDLIHQSIEWKILLSECLRKIHCDIFHRKYNIKEENLNLILNIIKLFEKEDYLFSIFPIKIQN